MSGKVGVHIDLSNVGYQVNVTSDSNNFGKEIISLDTQDSLNVTPPIGINTDSTPIKENKCVDINLSGNFEAHCNINDVNFDKCDISNVISNIPTKFSVNEDMNIVGSQDHNVINDICLDVAPPIGISVDCPPMVENLSKQCAHIGGGICRNMVIISILT